MASSAHNILLCACFVLSLAGQGSEAACTNQELSLLFTCITPYNAQFFQALGRDSGNTCNRTITGELCTSFTNIVTCVNGKQVSDVTCRPGAVGQINPLMEIPCKVEDFEAQCTSSPAINRGQGSEAACTNQELTLLFTCITPYNAQFFQALGRDSGNPCNRNLITGALCTSFTNIVTCVNGKQVSDVTCRPGAVGQINPLMEIPCKVEDFEAQCTSSPAINRGGSGSGSTTFNGASPLLVATLIAAVTSLGWR